MSRLLVVLAVMLPAALAAASSSGSTDDPQLVSCGELVPGSCPSAQRLSLQKTAENCFLSCVQRRSTCCQVRPLSGSAFLCYGSVGSSKPVTSALGSISSNCRWGKDFSAKDEHILTYFSAQRVEFGDRLSMSLKNPDSTQVPARPAFLRHAFYRFAAFQGKSTEDADADASQEQLVQPQRNVGAEMAMGAGAALVVIGIVALALRLRSRRRHAEQLPSTSTA
eukprot:PLAT11004.1.p1 GENE.PLAT11004.1~~PLAT11004.1.p1  ORF type:complete len:223 (+),score=47.61 PLAT11004.1:25-693(+)